MNRIALVSILIFLFALTCITSKGLAVPSGKTVDYADGSAGKVVFSGKIHADKGLKCSDCHPKLFPMKRTTEPMKMSDMNAGKYCGACHNGTKAFATNNPADCSKCHKK